MLVKVFPNTGKKGKRGTTYFSTDPKLFIIWVSSLFKFYDHNLFLTQTNKKAAKEPKASLMYVYSAPDSKNERKFFTAL